MSSEIRLLVVDDSAVTRQLISHIVEQDRHIRIVGRARNGQDALDKIVKLKPDVVTLDVEMPVMDGLETLARIMEVYPVPVVMLSSLTRRGAQATLKALELGAVDFLPKPSDKEQLEHLAFDLPAKIKLAAGVPVRAKRGTASGTSGDGREAGSASAAALTALGTPLETASATASPSTASDAASDAAPSTCSRWSIKPGGFELVVLGVSTGGPSALQKVVPRLPAVLPVGMVIVQHMPKGFTQALAQRLDQNSRISVREAKEGDLIKPGLVLVAPAGDQLYLEKSSRGVEVSLRSESSVDTLFKPSVDVTMLSAAEVYGSRVLGVIMTGMGNDGVRGLREIKRRGGRGIAEAEESCVVFGMPKAAIKAGLIDEVHPAEDIAGAIIRAAGNP